MAYLISHFYEGGTAENYKVMTGITHPDGVLPQGQLYHAAGPSDGGFLVVAIWDSKASYDRFQVEFVNPVRESVKNGWPCVAEKHTAEIMTLKQVPVESP